jgi:clan AA aspartic protease
MAIDKNWVISWRTSANGRPTEEAMGEIRVRVKLSNAYDEELARRGQMAADQVRSLEADAVVDTGAVWGVIPAAVAEQLGVTIITQQSAEMVDGSRATVGVTGAIRFQIMDRSAELSALVLGNEVLIGQTVLESLDLVADCKNQRLVPGHPDGPLFRV